MTEIDQRIGQAVWDALSAFDGRRIVPNVKKQIAQRISVAPALA